jgi:hypothetical protein
MTRLPGVAAVALAALATTGCFDIEQTLTLDRRLAGTASFRMKLDLEPMVGIMVRMQREMAGKTGDPTQDEIAKARAEFLDSAKKDKPTDFEAEKRELSARLPAGVTLIDASFVESGLAVAVGLGFGFDHVSKLSQIQLPKSGRVAGGGGNNPVETPFGGLKVVDEGATILVTSPTPGDAPMSSIKGQAPPDPDAEKMVQDMLKGLRVAFKITAPFEVVQHNAHRREGNTLIWEYDLKAIEKLTPNELDRPIKVRYRK